MGENAPQLSLPIVSYYDSPTPFQITTPTKLTNAIYSVPFGVENADLIVSVVKRLETLNRYFNLFDYNGYASIKDLPASLKTNETFGGKINFVNTYPGKIDIAYIIEC